MALVATAACHASTSPARPASPDRPAASAPVGQLQHDLETIINDPALVHGTWGVLVQSLKSGDTLFSWNPQKLLLPASNMKLVTLAAAAAQLGWDYTYQTRLLAGGPVNSGVLSGDLIVVGSGDPSIGQIDGSAERLFGEWADRLKQLGVRAVDGRIIGDDNAFDDVELGFGWSWDDLTEDYAAGVSALQFNENAIRVAVSSGPAPGDPAVVNVDPLESGIAVVNAIRTGAAGSATNLATHRLPGQRTLVVEGTIAAGTTTPAVLTMSVDNPTLFFVQALRRSLIARGIDVHGPAVDIDDLTGSSDETRATSVAVHRSPPLSTLAVRLMKVSQNQYAETFLKTLGQERDASAERSPASALKGRTGRAEALSGLGRRLRQPDHPRRLRTVALRLRHGAGARHDPHACLQGREAVRTVRCVPADAWHRRHAREPPQGHCGGRSSAREDRIDVSGSHAVWIHHDRRRRAARVFDSGEQLRHDR